ncbi:MAG: metallophosphoesterase [Bacillota bacterium]|nr:metallophosphoesterase [Bacillota bacterium]
MRKRIRMIIVILAVLAAVFITYGTWCNKALELNTYRIESDALPKSFDGFRMIHISDLHNTEMGEDNEKLLEMIEEAKPDIIAITGDLIDSRRTDVDVAVDFIEEVVKIAPCYYVTGNHEQRIEEYSKLKEAMYEAGVTILDNKKMRLEKDGEHITIAGVDDPMFTMDPQTEEPYMVMEKSLTGLLESSDGYTVLLSHRSELMDTYVQSTADLVLTGHAHGGQIKFPFIGGVISPGEGLFPEYYEGIYEKENTQMVVSRGIGNSLFPWRINNRPEVGLVVLEKRSDR